MGYSQAHGGREAAPGEQQEQPGPVNSSTGRILRIGCALLPKKVARYLTPAMKAAALARGIELTLIDYGRSLSEQGRFDAIIHKLRPNPDWERNLTEYCRLHPDVAVIDRVDGIRLLHNRATMLTPLQGDGITVQSPLPSESNSGQQQQQPQDPGERHDHQQQQAEAETGGPQGPGTSAQQRCTARVQAPTQVEIPEGMGLEEARQLLDAAGLEPPLLVKPLWTDGREGSHGLAVLHDASALGRLLSGNVSSDLQPPLVVQQYVEHGGVLYKVYVLGTRTVVSRRHSLGEVYFGAEARRNGISQLPRISCKGQSGVYCLPGSANSSFNSLAHLLGDSQSGSVADLATLGLQPPLAAGPSQSGYSSAGGASPGAYGSATTLAGAASGAPSSGAGLGHPSLSSPAPWGSGQFGGTTSSELSLSNLGLGGASPPITPAGISGATPGPGGDQGPGSRWQPGAAGLGGGGDADSSAEDELGEMLPPHWAMQGLATELRQRLGLQLFNFDLICPEDQPNAPKECLYYVIDINYFPGVDKIPDFEHVFVDFLRSAVTGEPQALPSTPRDEPEEGSGAYRPYPYRQPVPQEQRGRASREHQVLAPPHPLLMRGVSTPLPGSSHVGTGTGDKGSAAERSGLQPVVLAHQLAACASQPCLQPCGLQSKASMQQPCCQGGLHSHQAQQQHSAREPQHHRQQQQQQAGSQPHHHLQHPPPRPQSYPQLPTQGLDPQIPQPAVLHSLGQQQHQQPLLQPGQLPQQSSPQGPVSGGSSSNSASIAPHRLSTSTRPGDAAPGGPGAVQGHAPVVHTPPPPLPTQQRSQSGSLAARGEVLAA